MLPGQVDAPAPAAEQLHPVPVAETKPSPVGRLSVTVSPPVVAAVPTFVTLSVYTPFCPTVKLPVWLFAIATSTCVTGVVMVVDGIEDGLGILGTRVVGCKDHF